MYVRKARPRILAPFLILTNTFSFTFLLPKRGVIAFPEISNPFDISNFNVIPLVSIYLNQYLRIHYGLSLILMVSRRRVIIYYFYEENVIHHSSHTRYVNCFTNYGVPDERKIE